MKKIFSLFFILSTVFFFSSTILAANNTRQVYSVYSDSFYGSNIYNPEDSVPESDTDGIKLYLWETSWEANPHLVMTSTSVISDDAPEGREYTKYMWGSKNEQTGEVYVYNYVGCGYTRVKNVDGSAVINMNEYAGGKIKFCARSSKSYATKCKVGFQKSSDSDPRWLYTLTDISSGWKEFEFNIPNIDLSDVRTLFVMMIEDNVTHPQGEEFLDIDNIRWIKSTASSAFLDITEKNISDDQEVSSNDIVCSTVTYQEKWCAAEQYLELDIDGEFDVGSSGLPKNNWAVRVYSTEEKSEDPNKIYGLHSDTGDDLAMAWRVSCSTLPYVYTDDKGEQNINTLEIEETWDGDNLAGLCDAGKGEGGKWWFPWLFMQPKDDTGDNSLVWNYNGCHTFMYNGKPQWDSPKVFRDKPKIYFAIDARNAKAVKYTGSAIVNLSYE